MNVLTKKDWLDVQIVAQSLNHIPREVLDNKESDLAFSGIFVQLLN
jgi:hypothetical protein